jgi:hypothetical protein
MYFLVKELPRYLAVILLTLIIVYYGIKLGGEWSYKLMYESRVIETIKNVQEANTNKESTK